MKQNLPIALDAPDLVATAPIGSSRILWAKIEAVIGMIALCSRQSWRC